MAIYLQHTVMCKASLSLIVLEESTAMHYLYRGALTFVASMAFVTLFFSQSSNQYVVLDEAESLQYRGAAFGVCGAATQCSPCVKGTCVDFFGCGQVLGSIGCSGMHRSCDWTYDPTSACDSCNCGTQYFPACYARVNGVCPGGYCAPGLQCWMCSC